MPQDNIRFLLLTCGTCSTELTMNRHVPINNSIEGWHRSSQAHVLAYYPVFRKLLSVLQKEKTYDSYIYCLQVKEFSKLLAIIQIGKGFNN